jgi:hypothetical protein
VLNLIQPSFTIPATGLSDVLPDGTAIAVLVKTSAILPVSGTNLTSNPPSDLN